MIWRQLERRPLKALFTIFALAFTSAILMLAQFQRASIEYLAAVEGRLAWRHDIAATFVELRPRRILHELRAMQGVAQAEGGRSVAVRLVNGQYTKLTNIEGIAADSTLRHLIDSRLRPVPLPDNGLIMDDYLAEMLHIQVGDRLWVEMLEGRQQRLYLPVVQRVKNFSRLSVYMDLDALNRILRDGDVINRAYLVVENGEEKAVLKRLDQRPQILGAEERDAGMASLRKMIDENVGIIAAVVLVMGLIVNFGILYNTMRMNLSERSRELASLRVLGLRKGEISYILFGEIGLLVLLSIPLGLAFGYGLAAFIANGMQNEMYRIPMVIYPGTYSYVALVTLFSALVSALAVYHRIHGLDLIEVLKTRE